VFVWFDEYWIDVGSSEYISLAIVFRNMIVSDLDSGLNGER